MSRLQNRPRRGYAVLLVVALFLGCRASHPPDQFFVEARLPVEEQFGFATKGGVVPTSGKVHVLVIYAKFKGEAPDNNRPPSFASSFFDPDAEGSMAHFFRTMSFGQLEVEGTVLPKRYTSDRPASEYLAATGGGFGRFDDFSREILRKVDADVDLGRFDNNGSDGIPNSRDDDGRVDFVFLNLLSTPRNFIIKGATGVSSLGTNSDDFESADSSGVSVHKPVRVNFQQHYGALQKEGTFAETVGVMAHEFGHALGLPDLYDLRYETPEDDSAGIGRWGLMGMGAHGWRGNDGPNSFCAWSLERLGWIGSQNERMVEIDGDTTGLVIADLNAGGSIYKIPLKTQYRFYRSRVMTTEMEYLLLEHRTRTSNYYDRHSPAEGLLIWRVQDVGSMNHHEESKMVDLVCADGSYEDAGYPLGKFEDPQNGRDNLDFWAHDADYSRSHGGNVGDATDPFDGIQYTGLGHDANPSTATWGVRSEANSGLTINNIHPQGKAIVVNIVQPRWSGTIEGEVFWSGKIIVDGDLTIAPQGKLVLGLKTQVRFAGTDRLRSGRDPERCELHVEGELSIEQDTRSRHLRQPIVFEALAFGETWHGIHFSSTDTTMLRGLEKRLELRDTAFGFVSPGTGVATAVETKPAVAAAEFELKQNYPNPFDHSTTIPYALGADGPVRLQVYNTLGQAVRTLVDDYQEEGVHEVLWDGQDESGQSMATGLYLYHFEVPGQFAANGKMTLLGSGMAQLTAVDSVFRVRGEDWSLVAADLAKEAAPAFGFVAEPSTAQAAFTAGARLIKLTVLQQYGRDPESAQIQAQHLSELLDYFDSTPAQRRAVEDLARDLRTDVDPAQVTERLDEVHRTLARLVQDRGDDEALYFYLGKWLQTLKAGATAALRLRVELAEVADLANHLATSRHMEESLGALTADDTLLAGLSRLTAALEADPRSRREIREVLELVERIIEPLGVR